MGYDLLCHTLHITLGTDASTTTNTNPSPRMIPLVQWGMMYNVTMICISLGTDAYTSTITYPPHPTHDASINGRYTHDTCLAQALKTKFVQVIPKYVPYRLCLRCTLALLTLVPVQPHIGAFEGRRDTDQLWRPTHATSCRSPSSRLCHRVVRPNR